MQIKSVTLFLAGVFMTNFSAFGQTLDKRLTSYLSQKKGLAVSQFEPERWNPTTKAKKNQSKVDFKGFGSQFSQNLNSGETRSRSEGGVATGGGNSLKIRLADEGRVEKLIRNAKDPVHYAVRSLETLLYLIDSGHAGVTYKPTAEKHQVLQSLKKKIFDGGQTIYDALRLAELQPKSSGACLDREGNEVDASAIDAPTICMSVERLAKLNEDSLQREIVALVAHEVSHMLGTDEAEATLFQEMVRTNLSRNLIDKNNELVMSYAWELRLLTTKAEQMESVAKNGRKEGVCSSANAMYTGAFDLLKQAVFSSGENGIAYLRPKEAIKLAGVVVKAMNVAAYCTPPPAVFMNNKFQTLFNGRDVVALPEFYKELYQEESATHMPVPNWTIRRIQDGDESLKSEMADIKSNLREILSKIFPPGVVF